MLESSLPLAREAIEAPPAVLPRGQPAFLREPVDAGADQALVDAERREQANEAGKPHCAAMRRDGIAPDGHHQRLGLGRRHRERAPDPALDSRVGPGITHGCHRFDTKFAMAIQKVYRFWKAGASPGGEMNQFNQALFANFAAALAPDAGPSNSNAVAGVTTDSGSGNDVRSSVIMNPGPTKVGTDVTAAAAAMLDPAPSNSDDAFTSVNAAASDPTLSSGSDAFAGVTTAPGSDSAASPPMTWQQSTALMSSYMASTFTPPAFADSGSSDLNVLPVPLVQSSLASQPIMGH